MHRGSILKLALELRVQDVVECGHIPQVHGSHTLIAVAQVDIFVFLANCESRVLQNLHHAREKFQHYVSLAASDAAIQDLHFSEQVSKATLPRAALSVTLLVYHVLYLPPIF